MTIAPAPAESQDRLDGPDTGRRIALGGVQRTLGFALVSLTSVGGAVLLLRTLGVRDFGRYGTVMALLTIVLGVSDGGLTLTGARDLAVTRTIEERRRLLAHLIGLRAIFSGIGVSLAIVFAWGVGYPTVMVEGTALAGAGVFVTSVQGAMVLPLTTELRNWRLAVNDVLTQGLLVACFAVLAITGGDLLSFLGAQLAASLLIFAITPLLITRRHWVRPLWSPSEILSLSRRTLPLAISGALVVVYFRVLVILVSLFEHNPVQVGFFVTSERIIESFLALPIMLVGVVLPVMSVSARDNTERLGYITLRTTQMMAVLGTLCAVTLATGARPIILVLGGAQYGGAVPVLRIQCFALITVFITQAWSSTLIGMVRVRELAMGTAVGVGAVLVLGIALIIPFGANGGAIASVGADVIYCGAVFWFMCRTGAARSMTLSPFIRVVACAAGAFAFAILSPLPDVVNCVLATLLYVSLTVIFGALPPEVAGPIRRAFARLSRPARHR